MRAPLLRLTCFTMTMTMMIVPIVLIKATIIATETFVGFPAHDVLGMCRTHVFGQQIGLD